MIIEINNNNKNIIITRRSWAGGKSWGYNLNCNNFYIRGNISTICYFCCCIYQISLEFNNIIKRILIILSELYTQNQNEIVHNKTINKHK